MESEGAGQGARDAGGGPPGAADGERTSVWVKEEGSSCGVRGCLYGAMLLFAALMVAMLYILFMRFGLPS